MARVKDELAKMQIDPSELVSVGRDFDLGMISDG